MNPRPIHVICPKDHRIGTITLHGPFHGDSDQLRIGAKVIGLRGQWVDVYRRDPATGRTLHGVEIVCGHRNCPYVGRFIYSSLIAELAESGREHRLSN